MKTSRKICGAALVGLSIGYLATIPMGNLKMGRYLEDIARNEGKSSALTTAKNVLVRYRNTPCCKGFDYGVKLAARKYIEDYSSPIKRD